MKSLTSILPLAGSIVLTCFFAGSRTCGAADARKGVEFYLLEDGSADYETARKQPLAELKLRAEPWIAADNIERYDWQGHYVYLKKPVAVPVAAPADKGAADKGAKGVGMAGLAGLAGKSFVVTADGQRCYRGEFTSPLASSAPKGNLAMVTAMGREIERFEIYMSGLLEKGEERKDLRDHPKIKEVLKRDGLLHAGLECSLDGVTAERNERALTIVYTYTLRNRDEDGLYVLDPQKCPPNAFFTYGNAIVAQNLAKPEYFRWTDSIDRADDKVAKKELSWYTLLKKGETMTRTVTMNVTLRAAPEGGNYKFYMNFIGHEPVENTRLWMNANDNSFTHLLFNKPDGRIWLGQISAELAQAVK
jgi:hypothetical protein